MNERPRFNLNLKETPGEYNFLLFESIKRLGVDFATGVPCGVQKHLISLLASDPEIRHVPATRESEAIGIAAGAYLAGKSPIIYMQNSGLLDSINSITSLLIAYEIPVLFSVTWRGYPGETAPQHFLNGKVTTTILDAISIPWYEINKENIEKVVGLAGKDIKTRGKSAVLLLPRGVLK
jgi:sulfopyruvate decarboxylase subunit alpha